MMVLKIYLKNGNMLTYTNDESNWDLTQDIVIEIKSKFDNHFIYVPWSSVLYIEEYILKKFCGNEEHTQDDEWKKCGE